ncbi:hypothetical protein HYW41_02340 [Candidatus Daviesbacteria bacterium]|nr:hypothetical protein [Candidatus Daviesbacteria bacterium]
MTITKKFEPEGILKKYPKKYVIFTVFFLLALMLAEIYTSNNVTAYGDKFDKLSALEKSLQTENQILENEIAKDSSLKVVASKSAQLGFTNSQDIQYIR